MLVDFLWFIDVTFYVAKTRVMLKLYKRSSSCKICLCRGEVQVAKTSKNVVNVPIPLYSGSRSQGRAYSLVDRPSCGPAGRGTRVAVRSG